MSNLNFNLNNDQRRSIDMYVTQYNQTNMQIDRLLNNLDEIRSNIQNIILNNQPRNNRIHRNSRYSTSNVNRYINRLLNDNRSSYQNIYYDYNYPINPSIYSNIQNNVFRNNELASFLNNFLNTTVPVRPTQDQIQNASRLIRYGDIENPLSETCPISLERFSNDDNVMQIIPCGHIFCESQFQEWFENNVRCPVCRYDIRNYRNSSRNTTNNSTSPNNNVSSFSSSSLNSGSNSNTNISDALQNQNNNDSPSDTSFSNINILRNPQTNEIDQLGFNITNTDVASELLSNITNRLFQSILNPQSTNNNDRFSLDPSNNILLFETIIRPNSSNNENNNNINNTNNTNINRNYDRNYIWRYQ